MGKSEVKKTKGGDVEPGLDPAVLIKNYGVMCKTLGISPNEDVLEIIRGDDAPKQISVDADLGPLGVRALTESFSGHDGKSYKLINTIRLWRSNIGEEGCQTLADLLRTCSSFGMNLCFLQLLDCRVNDLGCQAIGKSLQSGVNKTLLTLNLDHNEMIGTIGLKYLTEGLCTNAVLKRLSLRYCNIDSGGGKSIKNLLNGYSTQLEELCLKGNPIKGAGLKAFARSLGKNKVLKSLDISDADIGPDGGAIVALCEAMKVNVTLIQLKFDENHIEESGALVLFESGVFDQKTGNSTLKEFLVDYNIPQEHFTALLRAGGGGKKKKGKKKK